MRNERLRRAMDREHVTADALARVVGVDPKSAVRWVSQGRVPRAEARKAIARRLGEDSEWLWPELGNWGVASGGDVSAEIVASYASRTDMPTAKWWDLITRATGQIDLLGYTLYFLCLQHPALIETLQDKCHKGTLVRTLVADPKSAHVKYREEEENTPLTLTVRVNTTLIEWAPMFECENFSMRRQDIPLYNSIFRFDDQMLVTPHLYGKPGSQAPLLHLRRLGATGLFASYADHFESVWQASEAALAGTS